MRCFLSKNIIINNEDDAWFWLKKALNDDLGMGVPASMVGGSTVLGLVGLFITGQYWERKAK